METAAPYKPPLSQRINVRMIVFTVVMLLLIGYPTYNYLDVALTGGVKDLGNGYKQVDLKAMSTFPFDQKNGKLEDVPSQWRALDGQKVVLYGEMWNDFSTAEKLHSFELVYSIAKCCLSGPPQIQHFVHSKVVDNGKADYYPGQVKVTGTLNVNIIRGEQNEVISVYQLYVDSVEPA